MKHEKPLRVDRTSTEDRHMTAIVPVGKEIAKRQGCGLVHHQSKVSPGFVDVKNHDDRAAEEGLVHHGLRDQQTSAFRYKAGVVVIQQIAYIHNSMV